MSNPNLESLIESLAAKVHQSWMEERRTAGWTYGAQRDDRLKHSPCLVTYDALPESEKDVDRRVTRTVVQGLTDLGYVLARSADPALPSSESPTLEGLRQQLSAPTELSLTTLTRLWNACRNVACPADVYLRLGERLLKGGEPILAYDILTRARTSLEGREVIEETERALLIRVRQQLALALAQSGASERARQYLVRLCEEGHDTPESLGLLGRVYKDLSLKSADTAKRQERMREARESYLTGFHKGDAAYRGSGHLGDASGAYYCGINAAAVSALTGDLEQARAIAGRVAEICESELKSHGGSYWLWATLGEAELILGRHVTSRKWYAQAVAVAGPGSSREVAATRKQARLLSSPLGIDASEWDHLFPNPSVVIFGSPAGVFEGIGSLQDWSARLREIFKQRLQSSGIVSGYLCATSPADLLLAEVLQEGGLETHLVLPFSRQPWGERFSGPWREKFDQVLERAASVSDDAQRSCLNEQVNLEFASLRAHGSACLRAQRLDASLHRWALEAVPWHTSSETALPLVELWRRLECPWDNLADGSTTARRSAEPRSTPQASERGAGSASHQIRAMLFADVRGYSDLDDPALLRFGEVFMGRTAEVLDGFSGRILSRRTAGDGLFLVFSEPAAAAETAFALRNMVVQTDWQQLGLPGRLGIRISLDAGPVYVFEDAVTGRTEVCGRFVNRAARIEPITPANEVYASEAFSALYMATGGQAFRFEYVGQTQLPKGYGLAPLYCLADNT